MVYADRNIMNGHFAAVGKDQDGFPRRVNGQGFIVHFSPYNIPAGKINHLVILINHGHFRAGRRGSEDSGGIPVRDAGFRGGRQGNPKGQQKQRDGQQRMRKAGFCYE